MALPSHIWWDYKNFTQYIIYALCAIEPSCLHSLNGHYPYTSIYPQPCWDDSYPSLIRMGTDVCSHSAIYRKFISVEWVSDEPKKCKLQKHESTVISTTCTRVGCFLVLHSFSGQNRARLIRFYRSLVSESFVTSLGVHTRGWMYNNIALHLLCYLAKVRPVTPPHWHGTSSWNPS